MNTKGLVMVWVLFFLAVFSIGYLTTHIIVTRAMADFKVEETGYTSLEVKDLPFTDKLQPAYNINKL